jgi:hypothetical protein
MMKNKILLILPCLALLWGCYPGGADYVDQLDIVLSNYSKENDFTKMKTYAMSDSIVKVTDDELKTEFVKQSNAATITARIRKNMTAYGWTEVDESQSPDAIILNAAMETTYINYYYNYWGWYYPYYPPYYPYYPPSYTTYTTGTLLVQMVDPKNLGPENQSTVVWTGLINGLTTGSSTSFNSRVNTTVDQLYAQSAYLKH